MKQEAHCQHRSPEKQFFTKTHLHKAMIIHNTEKNSHDLCY